MPDQPLDPALLIAAQAERLSELARQTIRDALEAGRPATVADVLAVLEGAAETLPAALAAVVAAELPKIAAAAIEQAEVEIADARAESGTGYPPVNVTEPGNYTPWLVTAVGSLIASLRKRVDMVPGDAPQVPLFAEAGELTPKEPAELDEMIRKAVDELFETMAARTVNDSRMEAFRANADIVRKVKVVTVADAKRSEICAHMSGATFDPKRPVPTPPYHAGCRSYLRAITTAKRKKGATPAEIYRQNWAIYRRLEPEAKKAAEAAQAESRVLEHLELRFAPQGDDAGSFAGYAVAWDVTDNHKTAFARGSLNLPATGLPLLWAHDPARPVGAIIEAREDDRGLFVRGKLTTTTRDGAEAHALLKDRAITGLSIGFKRLRDEAMFGGRRILAADLKEVSLVALPSNESARITEVRAHPAAPDADCTCHHHGVDSTMTTKAAASETGAETTTATTATTTETRTDPAAEVRSAVDALTKRLDKIEARSARSGLGAGNDSAEAEVETRAFNHFLRSGREAMGADEIRSLHVSDDTAGGYLAPAQFVAEIDKNLALFSPVRSVATVRNTSSGEVTALKRTSPAVATWVGEEEDRPETEIGYGAQNFSVAELATYVDVSNKLLDDASIDVAAELALEFAEAFGAAEATAFVNGNGVKKPTGFMTDTDIGFTLSGHASQITADGVIDLYHAVKPAYRQNGVWMANSTTLATLRKLKDPATGAYLLITGGIGNAPSTTILGRPVIEAPDMPDVGAGNFPLAFGDFGLGYTIWDRIALSIVRDPFTQATRGRTRFHGRRRVAAGVRRAEAIRKLKIAAA